MRLSTRIPFRQCARRKTQRGMALAGTLLLMMGIMTFILLGMINSSHTASQNGLMLNATSGIRLANARMNSVAAFNMAESGAQYTMQWMNSLPGPPDATKAFGPTFTFNSSNYSAGSTATTLAPDPSQASNTFSVTVYPDVSNAGNSQKKYLIESTGSSGGASQTVQVYIEVSSLSKWLILVNQWPASDNYWISGLNTFDGPVHDNNSNGLNEDVIWSSTATSPMWTYSGSDAYEVTGGVNWYENSASNQQAPQTAAQWQTILPGGASTFSTGAKEVPFPSNSNEQLDAALNYSGTGPLHIPAASGVTVTPNGGIYIHSQNSVDDNPSDPAYGETVTPGGLVSLINNDVQQMTMSVDGSGNQVITVLQNDDNGNPMTTTVTMNVAANKTQIAVSQEPPLGGAAHTTTSSVPGLTNGVIYSDGNIGTQGTAPGNPQSGTPETGGLDGVIANNTVNGSGTITNSNSLTIATADNKNTNLDGSLTYETARAKNSDGSYVPEASDSNFTTHAGTLGVVSDNVLVTVNDASGNPLNNVEVDGAVLAYGTYDIDQFTTRPVGNWENMGGYLSANMGYFGVANGSNQMVHGMNQSFNYDARMKDTPPPYFPTTSNNYDTLSWRRVGATLE